MYICIIIYGWYIYIHIIYIAYMVHCGAYHSPLDTTSRPSTKLGGILLASFSFRQTVWLAIGIHDSLVQASWILPGHLHRIIIKRYVNTPVQQPQAPYASEAAPAQSVFKVSSMFCSTMSATDGPNFSSTFKGVLEQVLAAYWQRHT